MVNFEVSVGSSVRSVVCPHRALLLILGVWEVESAWLLWGRGSRLEFAMGGCLRDRRADIFWHNTLTDNKSAGVTLQPLMQWISELYA